MTDDLPPGARRQRIDGPGRWEKADRRKYHNRPADRAMQKCNDGLPGYCECRRKGRFVRRLCEDKYQQAIQEIIADIRRNDPT